jgi:uncharacterized protein (TIGR02996 family)
MASNAELKRALKEALIEDPEDRASNSALADLLQEENDPRGELMQVQLALGDPTTVGTALNALLARQTQLLEAHQLTWLGKLAPPPVDPDDADEPWYGHPSHGELAQPVRVFRNGFFADYRDHAIDTNILAALAEDRDSWLLQSLEFDGCQREITLPTWGPHNALGAVRRFRLGPIQGDEYTAFEGSPSALSVVLPLLPHMPYLEELRLLGQGINLNILFALRCLKNLRVLQLYHGVQVLRLGLLADNDAFGNLTHLLIHPHHVSGYDDSRGADRRDGYQTDTHGYLPLEAIRPLLYTKNLPHLQHLRLRCSSMGDEGCRDIVASGILRRLKSLDLRHGSITDIGAFTLVDCPDARDLEWIDLDRNALTDLGRGAIEALGVPCRVEDQMTQRERQNGQFMYEGEFE